MDACSPAPQPPGLATDVFLSGGRATRGGLSTCRIPPEDASGRFCLTPARIVPVSLNEREADGTLLRAIAVNAVDGGCIAPGQSG